jgi:casein kinase II subunit alpha
MMQSVDKSGLVFPQQALAQFPQNTGSGWHRVVHGIRRHKADEAAIDLMKKLLTIYHGDRITAAEALEHPFFNPIRAEMIRRTNR